MKMNCKPETSLGKWSVGLQAFFVVVMIISMIVVNLVGTLSFEDKWWDVTVFVFLASIAAFIIGTIAIVKKKDHSILVYLSTLIGLCAIVFLLLHSLFIND